MTLGQVYAVLAFYLAHRDEVDVYVAERAATRDAARAAQEARLNPEGLRARLLAQQATTGQEPHSNASTRGGDISVAGVSPSTPGRPELPAVAVQDRDPVHPPNLPLVLQAIEESRWILDLADDWDGEGSPAYALDTWRRATEFLLNSILRQWEYFGVSISPPNIDPGPNGSVDLHWKTPTHELLINIPADSSEPAGYYGDSRAGRVTKGSLDTSTPNQWLLMWAQS
ncbi:MAG TPA: hypothetical protein VLA19_19700 [Herpetosiphonaceae bacterium]|nr:hypothetical protein [Herpetosiphonaceae bacterium]